MNTTKKTFATVGVIALFAAFASLSQAQPYYVAGDFNGWDPGANQMTGGPDTYDYVITNGTPGAYEQFKVTDGTWTYAWPSANVQVKYDAGGSNTVHFIPGPPADGWSPILNRVGYDDPGNMSWELTGDFTSPAWGSDPAAQMTLVSNGLYTVDYVVPTPGAHEFKFRTPGTWNEANFGVDFGNGSGNATVQTTETNQSVTFQLDLPHGRWLAGSPVMAVTNEVVFLVNMSVEEALGRFDPAIDQVYVSGAFNGWPGVGGSALVLVNDPPWNGNTNIYYATNTFVAAASSVGSEYKFTDSNPAWSGANGYEPIANNRSFNMLPTNGVLILPLVTFGNAEVSDYLAADTLVTFTINMTNATTATDLDPPIDPPHVFDPSTDYVYINGNFLSGGWIENWNPLSLSGTMMVNNPLGSQIYQFTYLVPKGSPVEIHYKYGIDWPGSTNSIDNEAPAFQDVIRYIRSTATGTYDMPTDTFGDQHVEPSFGQLAVGPAVSGEVPVTWLGRPGVHLQTASDLASGSWTDLPETDGDSWSAGTASPDGLLSATNWPAADSNLFFRLIKPAN